MIKWKQTGKNTALSSEGHKLLMTDIHSPEPIYTVFSKAGIKLGSTIDRSKINQLTREK